jgi:putative endonuclease
MNAERRYYVYILASGHTLYIGVTNDVRTRLEQHRSGRGSNFVQKYKVLFTWKLSRHRKKPSRARSS